MLRLKNFVQHGMKLQRKIGPVDELAQLYDFTKGEPVLKVNHRRFNQKMIAFIRKIKQPPFDIYLIQRPSQALKLLDAKAQFKCIEL
ncbi:hypothetical protein [Ravibacter arvi]|uniref:hypothetical protein n=1 Tax=Ravibacter arvi TaxID=2051041 RepID=UPI0031EF0A9A